MLVLPEFDPNVFTIGPIAVKWYAVAYIAGLVAMYQGIKWFNKHENNWLSVAALDDLLVYATLGIIIGGRLGYVLLYNFSYYWRHWWQIFAVWQGGMSFHGGLFGSCIAMYLFAKHYHLNYLHLMDTLAILTPPGLLFGRLANFINLELYGRPTTVPWGMVFPGAGELPRHPSQLYEAGLEGVVLGVLFLCLLKYTNLRQNRTGTFSGTLLIAYSLCRYLVEFVREPDPQLGLIVGNWTMGQILSLPMLLLGIYLWYQAFSQQKQL